MRVGGGGWEGEVNGLSKYAFKCVQKLQIPLIFFEHAVSLNSLSYRSSVISRRPLINQVTLGRKILKVNNSTNMFLHMTLSWLHNIL